MIDNHFSPKTQTLPDNTSVSKPLKLAERIKSLRKQRGMNQVELANVLNVTKQSVSNWENDNILPSIEMLVRIAGFFDVSTDYLLGLDNKHYLEITGLSEREITHIQQLVDDLRG